MSTIFINTINDDQCIGDSLQIINDNFSALDTSIVSLSATVDSIPPSYNDTALRTLINTLSTDMMKIGNYPYLEYAWVTAPNTAGQSLSPDVITTLYLNTEIADLGNYGTLTAGSAPPATVTSSFSLAAGTYEYEAFVSVTQGAGGGNGIFGLRRVGSTYISRTGSQGGASDNGDSAFLRGQFTLTATQALELTYLPINGASVFNSKSNQTRMNSTANADQRTTIRLWKVG